MGVLCFWGEGTRASHGNGALDESVGSGDSTLIYLFYLRDDLRRVNEESPRVLFFDNREICGEGLGVWPAFRRAEDGLKSYFRFCDEPAKQSFAEFDSPLIAGMLQKEFGRLFVGFETRSYAALKMINRIGVVTPDG